MCIQKFYKCFFISKAKMASDDSEVIDIDQEGDTDGYLTENEVNIQANKRKRRRKTGDQTKTHPWLLKERK